MAEQRGFAVALHAGCSISVRRGKPRSPSASARTWCGRCAGQDGEAGLAAVVESGALPRELSPFAADLLSLPRSADDLALFRLGRRSHARRRPDTAAAKPAGCRCAAPRPQLILVEDVHWADPGFAVDAGATCRQCDRHRGPYPALFAYRRRSDRRRLAGGARGMLLAHHRLAAAVRHRLQRKLARPPLRRMRRVHAALRGARRGQPAVPGAAAAQPCDRSGRPPAPSRAWRGAGAAGPAGAADRRAIEDGGDPGSTFQPRRLPTPDRR